MCYIPKAVPFLYDPGKKSFQESLSLLRSFRVLSPNFFFLFWAQGVFLTFVVSVDQSLHLFEQVHLPPNKDITICIEPIEKVSGVHAVYVERDNSIVSVACESNQLKTVEKILCDLNFKPQEECKFTILLIFP